jgi:hypothetical protein
MFGSGNSRSLATMGNTDNRCLSVRGGTSSSFECVFEGFGCPMTMCTAGGDRRGCKMPGQANTEPILYARVRTECFSPKINRRPTGHINCLAVTRKEEQKVMMFHR